MSTSISSPTSERVTTSGKTASLSARDPIIEQVVDHHFAGDARAGTESRKDSR